MKQTTYSISKLYPTMQPSFQYDYEEVRLLLASPSRISLHLDFLEKAICSIEFEDPRLNEVYRDHLNHERRFDRLEVALAEMEAKFKFNNVIRIAPGGNEFSDPRYGANKIRFADWVSILEGAHPFRDYGASLPHGEVTHRVQWYVICVAGLCGDLSLSAPAGERVVELYRAASIREHRRLYHRSSDDVKYMKSVWSDLFDYGLTKVIDGRSTLWLQREIIFSDWKNYFPVLSQALCARFTDRGGSLEPWDSMNEQFFNGSAIINK